MFPTPNLFLFCSMATPPQEELDRLALETQKEQENQEKKSGKSGKKNKEKVEKPKPGTALVPRGVRVRQGSRRVFASWKWIENARNQNIVICVNRDNCI